MNRPIRRVAVACLLLFGALLVNANVVQVGQASSLKKRPENSRQLTERLQRERGPIVVSGQAVAESRPVNDEYKFQRAYPFGPLYSDVTGYYTLFTATGIEKAQDDLLSGEDDRLFVSRLSDLITGRKPRGGTVVLTLDRNVQEVATRALGNRRGAVVALDPRTGEILAMATSPAYDPNPLADHDGAAAQAAFQKLVGAPGRPLLNRATQETYPPGSTFKVVTAAAALSSGRYTPDTRIPSPDRLLLPGTRTFLPNFGGETCGDGRTTTLVDALTISCNTAFAQLGLDLGQERLRAQAEAFGLNATVDGFPLPQATSVFPRQLRRDELAQSAIGQRDVRVTPLQMAMVAGAIGNGGRLMKPFLVRDLLGPDLKSIGRTAPEQLGRPLSGEVAAQLTTMMDSVVARGTGTGAQIPNVTVAGKTGTAEHAVGQPPHAWFIGFAPAESPRVAVAVVVEDGGGELSATGGAVAAPVAQQVMVAALGGR